MSVEIATNPEFKPGKLQLLGFAVASVINNGLAWDSLADSRRFLVAAHAISPVLVLLTNLL